MDSGSWFRLADSFLIGLIVILLLLLNVGAWFWGYSGKQWRLWQRYIPGIPDLTGRQLVVYDAIYKAVMLLLLIVIVFILLL